MLCGRHDIVSTYWGMGALATGPSRALAPALEVVTMAAIGEHVNAAGNSDVSNSWYLRASSGRWRAVSARPTSRRRTPSRAGRSCVSDSLAVCRAAGSIDEQVKHVVQSGSVALIGAPADAQLAISHCQARPEREASVGRRRLEQALPQTSSTLSPDLIERRHGSADQRTGSTVHAGHAFMRSPLRHGTQACDSHAFDLVEDRHDLIEASFRPRAIKCDRAAKVGLAKPT